MQISGLSQPKSAHIPIEYSVYAYDKYHRDIIGYNKWQCLLNSHNKDQALKEAQRLFETRKFQKIEVKKKVFSSKGKDALVSTFRVFDSHDKRDAMVIIAMSFVVIALAGLCLLEIL